jgi:hypothetical protein
MTKASSMKKGKMKNSVRGRTIYVVGEGVGNIIQTLPTLGTVQKALGRQPHILLAKPSFQIPKEFFTSSMVFTLDEFTENRAQNYVGKIMTIWGSIHAKGHEVLDTLPTLNDVSRQQMRLDTSEVRVYLNAAEDLGLGEAQFEYNVRHLMRVIGTRQYDVVLANGYNYKNVADKWEAKSYPYYEEVAARLKEMGLSVCSVGAPHEYIEGTANETNLPLTETAGLVCRARLVISNDSGVYHLAAALQTPTIVLFTFTSVIKNHDPLFHRTATVLKKDLLCQRDCHQVQRWKKEEPENWFCREIPVEQVMKLAIDKLEYQR